MVNAQRKMQIAKWDLLQVIVTLACVAVINLVIPLSFSDRLLYTGIACSGALLRVSDDRES